MELDKCLLDAAIREYRITPVHKYYELITAKDMIHPYVDVLNQLGIRITSFSWWCDVHESHQGDPHGGGGPRNICGDGWFSEMYHWDDIQFPKLSSVSQNNLQYISFYFDTFPKENRYLPCIVPGFQLDVPVDWINESDIDK